MNNIRERVSRAIREKARPIVLWIVNEDIINNATLKGLGINNNPPFWVRNAVRASIEGQPATPWRT